MNTYTIKSHTNPSLSYEVTFPDTGAAYCTCKGYGYRRHCSHIVEALSQLEQELQSLLHIAAESHLYFCKQCGLELKGTHTYTGLCPSCTRKQVFVH